MHRICLLIKVKVFFVMGTDSSGKEDLWIRREEKEFCDVIQVTIDQEEIRMLVHVSEMLQLTNSLTFSGPTTT